LQDEGFEVEATPGGSGQFDVLRDGELIFSKREVKRFPEPGEVLSLLRR
jgi:selT/selW/selH-like putative selenoprotein